MIFELGIMRIPYRRFLLALAASLLWLGCSDSNHKLDTKPEGARFTPREVMEIAKRTAEREGMNLDNYKEPEASYQSVRAKTWQVYFEGKAAASGKHFYIYMDDESEQTRFMPGE